MISKNLSVPRLFVILMHLSVHTLSVHLHVFGVYHLVYPIPACTFSVLIDRIMVSTRAPHRYGPYGYAALLVVTQSDLSLATF
jgi:hypothetical protein